MQAADEQLPVSHPDFPNLGVGITVSQLSGPTDNPNADWKNAVGTKLDDIDLDNPDTWKVGLDRCPCGTGTCAKMASLYAKGKLKIGEKFRHENALGIVYTGELVEKTKVHDIDAVVPTVGGEAWIYGYNTCVLDPTDPFPEGYRMGDIWAMKKK
jgi:proline racemase